MGSVGERLPPSGPPSGIKVIVVGTGFAGLTAAIECHRKGHTVTVLESFPELKQLGDIISFGPNGARIFQRWPGVEKQLEPICHKSDGLRYKTYQGEDLLKQFWTVEEKTFGRSINGHRGEFHEVVFKHALGLGIEILLGKKVEDYFETEIEAGVVTTQGERFVGDVVLAADGVRSRGRTAILGFKDKPKPSGYAIYRAWFDSAELAKDPDTKWMIEDGDQHCAWLGPDIHFIAASVKNGRDFSWVCTHKDDADVEESWQALAPVSDAARVVEGWDPVVLKIINATPSIVDWKLVYRDPLPTWVSPKSRIALIGDAAHPFLPTSIQGASQAMEDGVTIAVCLERAGKANAATALKAFEAIRYDRVRAAQKTGETTRDTWHKANWDDVQKNPSSMKLKREAWLLHHDAESFAEKKYVLVAELLAKDPEYRVPAEEYK